MRLNHSLMNLNCHKFPDSRDRASSANGYTSTFEKMPSYFTLKCCGPSLQSRISMQAANSCFTRMNIFLPSFNSDSVRTETMDSAVEPNFLVAYSSVSISTHIRMLLELSSFANEFFKQVFFSPSLSC